MFEIRHAVDQDLDACADLIAEYEGGEVAEWRAHLARCMSNPDSCLLVAVKGDVVLGYGRVEHHAGSPIEAQPPLPDGWYLSGIVVSNAHRRTGVGLRLCEARVAWVAERAAHTWFFTNVQNLPSRELHRRAGFGDAMRFRSARLRGGEGILGRYPRDGSIVPGDITTPGRMIFHITEPETWHRAVSAGAFTESTRGESLREVGYIHCSFADQVVVVADFIYQDREGDLLILAIDPERVPSEIRVENLDGGTEAFPHIYGPVPLDAVTATHVMCRQPSGWALPSDL